MYSEKDIGSQYSQASLNYPCRQKKITNEPGLPANIDLPDTLRPNFKIAPIIQAALDNNLEQVTLLLKNNANPNCMTLNGRTALHIATKNHNLAMMELLLKNGADPAGTYKVTHKKLTHSKIKSISKQKGRPAKKITSHTQDNIHTNKFELPEPYAIPLGIALSDRFVAGIHLLLQHTPLELLSAYEAAQLQNLLSPGSLQPIIKKAPSVLTSSTSHTPKTNTVAPSPKKTPPPRDKQRALTVLVKLILILLGLCTAGLIGGHMMPRATPRPASLRLSHPSNNPVSFSGPTPPIDICEHEDLTWCSKERYGFKTKNV